MDTANLKRLIVQIAEERGIPLNKAQEAIEAALATAYKKDHGKKSQIIRAKIDIEKGSAEYWQVKLVVDESMLYSEEEIEKIKSSGFTETKSKKVKFNPERHIMIEEARKISPKAKVGDELKTILKPEQNYGRIATQAAKQVILQKLKETERDIAYQEFQEKEKEVVSGLIQRIEKNGIHVDLGKVIGLVPKGEQVKGEFYRPNQRMKFYVLQVEESPKGPLVYLSRSHPKLVSKLFELEVPEISSGVIVIKSIAREPGFRTKIAVASVQEGIDPIGALVGQRGTRIMAVINELGGEKVDVVEYSETPEKYIANSLSPAKVLEVKIGSKNTALAIIAPEQLSLAIGKDGRNVRLATNLTNWKIDVRSSEDLKKSPQPGVRDVQDVKDVEDVLSNVQNVQDVEDVQNVEGAEGAKEKSKEDKKEKKNKQNKKS